MNMERPLTGAERVARRRAALRAQGLRPRTYWLPDTSTPEFKAKAHQSTHWLWDRAGEEDDVQAFIANMTDELLEDLDRRQALLDLERKD